MKETLVTVVEHAHYLKKAEKLLSEEQIEDVANALAADPTLGEVMRGTGGFRKFRYAGVKNKGKSGQKESGTKRMGKERKESGTKKDGKREK